MGFRARYSFKPSRTATYAPSLQHLPHLLQQHYINTYTPTYLSRHHSMPEHLQLRIIIGERRWKCRHWHCRSHWHCSWVRRWENVLLQGPSNTFWSLHITKKKGMCFLQSILETESFYLKRSSIWTAWLLGDVLIHIDFSYIWCMNYLRCYKRK